MKNSAPVLVLSFFLALNCQLLFGYEQDKSNFASADEWSNAVEDLKSNMSALLQKNEALVSENAILRQKVLELKNNLQKLNSGSSQEMPAVAPTKIPPDQTKTKVQDDNQALHQQIIDLGEEKNSISQTLMQTQEKRSSYDQEMSHLKSQIMNLTEQKNTLSEEKRRFQKTKDEKDRMMQALTESQALVKKLEAELSAERIKSKDRTQELKTLKLENSRLQNELDVAKKSSSQLPATGPLEIDQKALADSKAQLDVLTKRNKDLEKQLSDIAKGQTDLPAQELSPGQKELEHKVSVLESKNKDLEEKMSEYSQKISELKKQKTMIESLLEAQNKIAKKPKPSSEHEAQAVSHQIQAYKFASSGQNEKAIKAYQLAVENNPSNKDLYYNLGFIQNKIGRYEDAVANFKKVVELDPSDMDAHYSLSQIYKKISDEKSAKSHFDKYLELQNQKTK